MRKRLLEAFIVKKDVWACGRFPCSFATLSDSGLPSRPERRAVGTSPCAGGRPVGMGIKDKCT